MAMEHSREKADLHAAHERELRIAEAHRIDAIRAVDVAAREASEKVALAQAVALATQVTAAAEAHRSQSAAVAAGASAALSIALDPIHKDIAELRKAQYEAQGQKTQIIETRGGATATWQIVSVLIAAISVLSAIFMAVITRVFG